MTFDDYFRYSSEYREWLWSRKGIHTGSLTTDAAREMFRDFVRAWNKGRLSARYYAGIEPTSVASSSRTDYRWKFSDVDSRQLDSIRNDVNRATSAGKSTSIAGLEEDLELPPYGSTSVGPSLPAPTFSRPNPSSIIDREREREEREREYDRERKERREYRRTQREIEEELAPRATGRDRVYEKRREENSARRAHQASRHEDPTIDPYDDSERSATMEHLRKQELAQERRRAERDAMVSDKVAAAQAKEDKTMAHLRELARGAGHRV